MKKSLLVLALSLLCVVFLALAVSAESITVTDDGVTDITLGECVIEGLDREIPASSRGFTFVLDTDTNTAKITKWDNYATESKLIIPSTVTYGGVVYTVTAFDRIVFATDNGTGKVGTSNYTITHVYVPDTVTSIPNSAFAECCAMEYAYIGAGVETIGEKCFYFCGFTAGGYYVTVEKEVVDEETGEITYTTEKKSIEATGGNMGEIKEFIWKTQKITVLPSHCFHHMELDKNAIIEFPIENIEEFKTNCMSYNGYAFAQSHYFKGTGMFFDVFDITGIDNDKIASDAFSNSVLSSTIILRADQLHLLNATKLRGQGTAHHDPMNVCFIIQGGESAESAAAMSGSLWVPNAWYWHPGYIYYRFVFKGYINAYDGVDGLENQNGYGRDVVDYYFESEEKMNFYFNSVAATAKANDTYARFAKNSKGYFNVCVGDGTALAYNIKLNGETGAYYLEEYATGTACPTRSVIVGDDCTPSVVCPCCGFVAESGIPHTLEAVLVYKNGYLQAGAKVEACTNDGCTHKKETTLDALFVYIGYSVFEAGDGSIVQSFKVNKEAVGAYKEQNPSFRYGVVASTVDTPLDENGNALDNRKVIKYDATDAYGIVFEIKVIGVKNAPDVALVVCGYVVDSDGVFYLDNGETVDTPTPKSYNELMG